MWGNVFCKINILTLCLQSNRYGKTCVIGIFIKPLCVVDKLVIFQLVKKHLVFFETWKFASIVKIAQHGVFSWIGWIPSVTLSHIYLRYALILSYPYAFMSQRRFCWNFQISVPYARLVWRMPVQKRWWALLIINPLNTELNRICQ